MVGTRNPSNRMEVKHGDSKAKHEDYQQQG